MKFLKNFLYVLSIFMGIGVVSVNASQNPDTSQKPDKYVRVVLVGDKGVGKSTFINKLMDRHYDDNGTIEASDRMERNDFIRNFKLDEQHFSESKVQFNIWDTAGAKKWRKEVTNFIFGDEKNFQPANIVVIMHCLGKKLDKNGEDSYLRPLISDVKQKLGDGVEFIYLLTKLDKKNDDFEGYKKHVDYMASLAGKDNWIEISSRINDEYSDAGIIEFERKLKEICCKSEIVQNLYDVSPDNDRHKKFDPRWCQIL